MRIKNVTKKHQSRKQLISKSWPDSKIKFYESKDYFFIHEKSKHGQILSISSGSKSMTEEECVFAIGNIMKLSPEDVIMYLGPTGVLYIREKEEHFPRNVNPYH
jgi:hypothetical protein